MKKTTESCAKFLCFSCVKYNPTFVIFVNNSVDFNVLYFFTGQVFSKKIKTTRQIHIQKLNNMRLEDRCLTRDHF